jgi:tight adherence protein C
MSWVIAATYVAASFLLFAAVRFRIDPVIARRLRGIGEPSAGRAPGHDSRSRRVLLAVAGATAGAVALPLGAELPAVFLSLTMAAVGYRWADLVKARRARSFLEGISRRIPELLDLIAVSVGGGLSPRLALERSPDAIGGPLGEELGCVRRHVALGGSWSSALEDLARRMGLSDVRRLALTLRRSERFGAPVGEQLRVLARDVRAERAARQQERARRVPVTMLFPLVFLILPAFVLSAVVPAVLVAVGDVP